MRCQRCGHTTKLGLYWDAEKNIFLCQPCWKRRLKGLIKKEIK